MNPKVAILIVNWNGWKDTLQCLESVFGQGLPNCRTVVIDNGSRNDSVAKIRDWAAGKIRSTLEGVHEPVTLISYSRETAERGGSAEEEQRLAAAGDRGLVLIETGANLGFSGGNNVGMRYALAQGADYILLLNNDALFASPDTLRVMVEFMNRTPSAGACGGRLFYPDGEPQQSYGNFPALPRILGYLFPLYKLLPSQWLKGVKRSNVVPDDSVRKPLQVDWPSGACLMVRSQAVWDVGMLDERFFLYMEETDWCLRMKARGWDRYYLPQAEVIHTFGGSVTKTSTSMRQYHLESQFVYYRKHFGLPALSVVAAGYLLRSTCSIWLWRVSCALDLSDGIPSPEVQYWRRARRLAAAAIRNLLPETDSGQKQITAASTAVRLT